MISVDDFEDVPESDWVPIREAIADVALAYAQFMHCEPREALEDAKRNIFYRMKAELCCSRSEMWNLEYCDNELNLIESHEPEENNENRYIPAIFWKHLEQDKNSVNDWVSGLFCFHLENKKQNSIVAGAAFDVEVARSHLPVIGKGSKKIHSMVTMAGQRGRKRKWDWDGAMAAIVAQANTPDGLPVGHGAQAAISRMMAEWFRSNQGGEPALSEIGIRSARIIQAIEADRK